MQWTGIGNDVHLVEPVGTGVFYKYLRLYICNSKYTPWTKCFVALYMFIKVHRTNGFEIFSNPISVFFNVLFSVQLPLCTYKRFFNTEKNIYFNYMYIRINPKSIIPCTLFLFNSKCQTLCVIFSEKIARFPTEIFG